MKATGSEILLYVVLEFDRKKRLVMNWHSFLGNESHCKPLNWLKDIEKSNVFGALPPKSLPGFYPIPQAAKKLFCNHFFPYQMQSSSKKKGN